MPVNYPHVTIKDTKPMSWYFSVANTENVRFGVTLAFDLDR